MLKTDGKRRKFHSRQNKITFHDPRNIGILNTEFYMNVLLRGTSCFQKSLHANSFPSCLCIMHLKE